MLFGTKKRSAVAFVDYEHWFYGYNNKFQMRPNLSDWKKELEEEFNLKDLFIFGDFSEPNLERDMDRIKTIKSNVIHTASEKHGVDKDFTDVIILDQIYRYAAKKKSPEVFIIFTGDAHFVKVAEYLKEIGKKVIIYAVKFAFSNRLKDIATSYVEMPRQSQEKDHYNDLIFKSLYRLKSKPKSKATYWKTVQSVAQYNDVPQEKIKNALDNLIRQKYVNEKEETILVKKKSKDDPRDKKGKKSDNSKNGGKSKKTNSKGKKISKEEFRMITFLEVDWERVEAEGVWSA
ncbi:NYN domain-containing protein [Eubacterium xylanophilum]|uniref:NYN domain-containing protein n=1 Tax=Eubacterium xylanophilum TaxID=39497 RepID=UPI0004B0A8F4|nr:NYN domain-containing protein [Eubacterium xylanophilum]MCR5797340.1 NYN domain-containing protein [Eubacterium sp.]